MKMLQKFPQKCDFCVDLLAFCRCNQQLPLFGQNQTILAKGAVAAIAAVCVAPKMEAVALAPIGPGLIGSRGMGAHSCFDPFRRKQPSALQYASVQVQQTELNDIVAGCADAGAADAVTVRTGSPEGGIPAQRSEKLLCKQIGYGFARCKRHHLRRDAACAGVVGKMRAGLVGEGGTEKSLYRVLRKGHAWEHTAFVPGRHGKNVAHTHTAPARILPRGLRRVFRKPVRDRVIRMQLPARIGYPGGRSGKDLAEGIHFVPRPAGIGRKSPAQHACAVLIQLQGMKFGFTRLRAFQERAQCIGRETGVDPLFHKEASRKVE